MGSGLWSFLRDANNREVLAWFGAGVVVVASGIWAVLRYFVSRNKAKDRVPGSTVTAVGGAIATGRDIRESKINIRDRPKH